MLMDPEYSPSEANAVATRGYVLSQTATGLSGAMLRGVISGLVPSNNSGDPDHSLDFTKGVARSSDNTVNMVLGSDLAKNFSTVFTLGSGGMADASGDSGSPIALPTSGTVHIFLISNADGSVVNIIGDTDVDGTKALADQTAVANGLTKLRRIFSIPTAADGEFELFFARELAGGALEIIHDAPVVELAETAVQTGAAQTLTLEGVPHGLQVLPIGMWRHFDSSVSTPQELYIQYMGQTSHGASGSYWVTKHASGEGLAHNPNLVPTNSDGQIRWAQGGNQADEHVSLIVLGWRDERLA